jgi:hypothetical protein
MTPGKIDVHAHFAVSSRTVAGHFRTPRRSI